jgi:riboflavin kinase/FMN adenylyltransferase
MIHPLIEAPEVLDALSRGDIRQANALLGTIYHIHALVVHGNHLGRTLGFPTANLKVHDNSPFLLSKGVYAITAEADQVVYGGMANAGVRPTIAGTSLTIEVNLFDFTGDLYGKTLVVYFHHRIRDEKKFENLDQLVGQLNLDKLEALRLLA